MPDDPNQHDTTASPSIEQQPPANEIPWWKQHPGFGESLIPVWGSGREAVADYVEGDRLGAGLNAVLAASDLFVTGEVAKGLAKGGFKVAGPHDWRTVRAWLTQQGFAKPGQVVHHSFIERNRGIGKYVPDFIKNQPINLKPMPSAQIHDRLNHAAWGQPRLNPFERYFHGTPHWFKGAKVSAGGHSALGVKEEQGHGP